MSSLEKISNIIQNPKIVLPVTAAAVAIAEVFVILAALQILPHGVNAISQLGVGQIVGVGIAITAPLILFSLLYFCRKETGKTFEETDKAFLASGTF